MGVFHDFTVHKKRASFGKPVFINSLLSEVLLADVLGGGVGAANGLGDLGNASRLVEDLLGFGLDFFRHLDALLAGSLGGGSFGGTQDLGLHGLAGELGKLLDQGVGGAQFNADFRTDLRMKLGEDGILLTNLGNLLCFGASLFEKVGFDFGELGEIGRNFVAHENLISNRGVIFVNNF